MAWSPKYLFGKKEVMVLRMFEETRVGKKKSRVLWLWIYK